MINRFCGLYIYFYRYDFIGHKFADGIAKIWHARCLSFVYIADHGNQLSEKPFWLYCVRGNGISSVSNTLLCGGNFHQEIRVSYTCKARVECASQGFHAQQSHSALLHIYARQSE